MKLPSRFLDKLAEAKIKRGFAVVVGDEDGELSREIAARSSLHVIDFVASSQVDKLRQRLLGGGDYGSQVAVLPIAALVGGDLPPYFANAIILAKVPQDLTGNVVVARAAPLWRNVGRPRCSL